MSVCMFIFQERLVKSHGIQCGFCTPGMVMSMYTLLRNNPKPSGEDIERAISGEYWFPRVIQLYTRNVIPILIKFNLFTTSISISYFFHYFQWNYQFDIKFSKTHVWLTFLLQSNLQRRLQSLSRVTVGF